MCPARAVGGVCIEPAQPEPGCRDESRIVAYYIYAPSGIDLYGSMGLWIGLWIYRFIEL